MLTRAGLDMEAQCYDDHPVTCDTCTRRAATHLHIISARMNYITGCCRCTCCDVSSTCRTLEDVVPGLPLTDPADTERSRPAMEFILLRSYRLSRHSVNTAQPHRRPNRRLSESEFASQMCRRLIKSTISTLKRDCLGPSGGINKVSPA